MKVKIISFRTCLYIAMQLGFTEGKQKKGFFNDYKKHISSALKQGHLISEKEMKMKQMVF